MNEEETIILAIKSKLLSINTIILPTIPFFESSHEIMNYAKVKLIDIDNSLITQFEMFQN
jgi:hypothetical protein